MSENVNCKECNKKLETENEYYNVDIGDEITRNHNQSEKFDLCVDCWKKKKESYKSLVGKGSKYKDLFERELNPNYRENKIKVWKMKKYYGGRSEGMEEMANCKTCQKWSDEYEPVRQGSIEDYSYCSPSCEKNKDKPERERERERQKYCGNPTITIRNPVIRSNH